MDKYAGRESLKLRALARFSTRACFGGIGEGAVRWPFPRINSPWTINLNKSPRFKNDQQHPTGCKSSGTFFIPCNLFEAGVNVSPYYATTDSVVRRVCLPAR